MERTVKLIIKDNTTWTAAGRILDQIDKQMTDGFKDEKTTLQIDLDADFYKVVVKKQKESYKVEISQILSFDDIFKSVEDSLQTK